MHRIHTRNVHTDKSHKRRAPKILDSSTTRLPPHHLPFPISKMFISMCQSSSNEVHSYRSQLLRGMWRMPLSCLVMCIRSVYKWDPRPPESCLAMQQFFPSGHLWYCSKKIPHSPESLFPIGHHRKRQVCKTVDRHLELQWLIMTFYILNCWAMVILYL